MTTTSVFSETSVGTELTLDKLTAPQKETYDSISQLAWDIMRKELPWAGDSSFQAQVDNLHTLQNKYKEYGLDPSRLMKIKGLEQAVSTGNIDVEHYSVLRPGCDLKRAALIRLQTGYKERELIQLRHEVNQAHLAVAMMPKPQSTI